MANDISPRPIDLEDLRWWAKYAKSMPSYQEAQYIETALLYRLFGDDSSDKKELLESIRSYYFEKYDETIIHQVTKRISTQIESQYKLPKLSLDDDKIAKAVSQIQNELKDRTDYYSLFRILVDFCGWPRKQTDFCKKFTRLPIQEALLFPIVFDEKHPSRSPFYQSIQKGKGKDWPENYHDWLTYTEDSTFDHRRNVATKFLEILKELEKDYYSDTN